VSGARSREPPYPRREARVKGARFPQIKTLEDFDVSCQRSVRKDIVVHLGTLDFVDAKDNVMFLGPPGTGKTHLVVALRNPRLSGGAPGPSPRAASKGVVPSLPPVHDGIATAHAVMSPKAQVLIENCPVHGRIGSVLESADDFLIH
jgi:IstB-like ATP binding protein